MVVREAKAVGNGEFIEAMVNEMGDALISWTACGKIVVWNRAAERLLGYRADEVIGRNAGIVIPADLLEDHASMQAYLMQVGCRAEFDTEWRHFSGERIKVSLSMSRVSNELGKVRGVGCVLRPLTETARLINGLRVRAHTDVLTGALNRAGIEELFIRPDRSRGEAHRAILFIDLDGFKQVNDQAGHGQGDELLRNCAERIRNRLPAGHALARWGGDEFVVFLDGLPACEVAARQLTEITCSTLLSALRLSYTLGNRRYRCPASIGACVYRSLTTPESHALENADRAMYEVKAGGKDSYRLSGGASRNVSSQHKESRLVHAFG